MSRAAYPLEPPASKAGHKGLTERLARKAATAVERPRFFAPSYWRVPQVADQLKEAK